jgi:protein SCO1/2
MVRTAAAALVIACVGVAVLWQGTDGFRAFTAEGARRLSILVQPRFVPEARLLDMRGQKLKLRNEDGRAVVIEFIYTTCPTLCVALGESFSILQDTIKAAGVSDRVRLVSISFDPVRDGPQALADYARSHGADGRLWITARPENGRDLQALLEAFGVIVIPDGLGGFVHNAALHVVDREGRLKAIFDIGEEAKVLAAVRREQ